MDAGDGSRTGQGPQMNLGHVLSLSPFPPPCPGVAPFGKTILRLQLLPRPPYPFVSHFGVIEAVLAEQIVAKLTLSGRHLQHLLEWELILLALKSRKEAPAAQAASHPPSFLLRVTPVCSTRGQITDLPHMRLPAFLPGALIWAAP